MLSDFRIIIVIIIIIIPLFLKFLTSVLRYIQTKLINLDIIVDTNREIIA